MDQAMETVGETLIPDMVKNLHPKMSDSAERLISAGRMYEAVYNLVSVADSANISDTENLDSKINHLVDLMSGKYRTLTDDIGRAGLLSAMYGLINGTMTVADTALRDRWFSTAESLIDKYIGKKSGNVSETMKAWICRCITDYLYCLPYQEDDGYFQYLLGTAAVWAGTFDPENGWRGISIEEALGRIDVMDRISYMLFLSDWEHTTEAAYRYYTDRTSDMKQLPLGTLGLLYDIQYSHSQSCCGDDSHIAARTVTRILSFSDRLQEDSDEMVYVRSYCIKESCSSTVKCSERVTN